MPRRNPLIRLAIRIHRELARVQAQHDARILGQMAECGRRFSRIAQISRNLAVAAKRNWPAATADGWDRMRRVLPSVHDTVKAIQECGRTPPRTLPSLRTLYEELRQLRTAFGDFEFDPGQKTLSVETTPVQLEGVYLGPFQIRLDLAAIRARDPAAGYRVVALEPHPAFGHEAVTHPHVRDDRLNEYPDAATIRDALNAGRLADFFIRVCHLLHTCHPDTAYVRPADWAAVDCGACGTRMRPDERWVCRFCDRSLCENCNGYCRSCEATGCLACLTNCPLCGKSTCRKCLHSCDECGKCRCLVCLAGGNVCPTCKEANENPPPDPHGPVSAG